MTLHLIAGWIRVQPKAMKSRKRLCIGFGALCVLAVGAWRFHTYATAFVEM